MMIRRFFFLLMCVVGLQVQAQDVKMRDVMAEAPDSIFPMMTKNNRLDCIDFIENNMQARVKNAFDDYTELKALTADYLLMQLSDVSTMEMKLFKHGEQTWLCVVRTCLGPVADSDVRCYDLQWNPMVCVSPRPDVDAFLPADIDPESRGFLKAMPLIRGSLSPDAATITYELQLGELPRAQREALADKVHKVVLDLK